MASNYGTMGKTLALLKKNYNGIPKKNHWNFDFLLTKSLVQWQGRFWGKFNWQNDDNLQKGLKELWSFLLNIYELRNYFTANIDKGSWTLTLNLIKLYNFQSKVDWHSHWRIPEVEDLKRPDWNKMKLFAQTRKAHRIRLMIPSVI